MAAQIAARELDAGGPSVVLHRRMHPTRGEQKEIPSFFGSLFTPDGECLGLRSIDRGPG